MIRPNALTSCEETLAEACVDHMLQVNAGVSNEAELYHLRLHRHHARSQFGPRKSGLMQDASRRVERKYQAWSNSVRLRIAAACSAGLHRRNRNSSGTRTIPPGKTAAVRQRGPHEWASLRSAFHFARLDTGCRICSNLLSRTVRRHATSQSSGLLRSAIGLIKAEQFPS